MDLRLRRLPSALLPPGAPDTNYRLVAVAMTPLPYAIERRASEMSADA